MLSIFDHLKSNKASYINYAYNSDRFKDLFPKDVSVGARKKGLIFDPKLLSYWSEYFGQFDDADVLDPKTKKPGLPGPFSK